MEDDDKIRDFGELTKDEKKEVLRRLADDLGVEPGNLERFGIEGELTIRLMGEEGEEKIVETQSFKY